jgi:hypothetical protein
MPELMPDDRGGPPDPRWVRTWAADGDHRNVGERHAAAPLTIGQHDGGVIPGHVRAACLLYGMRVHPHPVARAGRPDEPGIKKGARGDAAQRVVDPALDGRHVDAVDVQRRPHRPEGPRNDAEDLEDPVHVAHEVGQLLRRVPVAQEHKVVAQRVRTVIHDLADTQDLPVVDRHSKKGSSTCPKRTTAGASAGPSGGVPTRNTNRASTMLLGTTSVNVPLGGSGVPRS